MPNPISRLLCGAYGLYNQFTERWHNNPVDISSLIFTTGGEISEEKGRKKIVEHLQPVSMEARRSPWDACRSAAALCSSCRASDRWIRSGWVSGDSIGGLREISGVIRWTTMASWGSATSSTFSGVPAPDWHPDEDWLVELLLHLDLMSGSCN